MELKALVLRVDVLNIWVTAIWLVLVELRLRYVSKAAYNICWQYSRPLALPSR